MGCHPQELLQELPKNGSKNVGFLNFELSSTAPFHFWESISDGSPTLRTLTKLELEITWFSDLVDPLQRPVTTVWLLGGIDAARCAQLAH